jgi:hypothetical protein
MIPTMTYGEICSSLRDSFRARGHRDAPLVQKTRVNILSRLSESLSQAVKRRKRVSND